MNLSKRERLLALGSSLYLLGLEVKGDGETMEKLLAQGVSLSDPKILEANRLYNANCKIFSDGGAVPGAEKGVGGGRGADATGG